MTKPWSGAVGQRSTWTTARGRGGDERRFSRPERRPADRGAWSPAAARAPATSVRASERPTRPLGVDAGAGGGADTSITPATPPVAHAGTIAASARTDATSDRAVAGRAAAHPGGQSNARPPMRWTCRWSTVWPPQRPTFVTSPVAGLGDAFVARDLGRHGEEAARRAARRRRSGRRPRRCARGAAAGRGSGPAARCRGWR